MEGNALVEVWQSLRRRWLLIGERTRALIAGLLWGAIGGIAVLLVISVLGRGNGNLWEISLNLLLGIITAVVVGLILNAQVARDLDKKFQIIRHAEHANLVCIYEDRSKALEKLAKDADTKREEQIDILTIAGKNFFHSGSELYKALFERPLSRGMPHRFRVLLLHPNSNAAVERSHRELSSLDRERLDQLIADRHSTASVSQIDAAAPYRRRSNCRDVLTSLDDLQSVHGSLKAKDRGEVIVDGGSLPRLQVRLHYSTPSLQIVRFDDRVMVEQYHLGKNELHASQTMDNCLARKVPVFEYLIAGAPGALFLDHFEYLWGRSEPVIGEGAPADLEELRRRFGDPERYVANLAALHIYGDKLRRFLRPPPERKLHGDVATSIIYPS